MRIISQVSNFLWTISDDITNLIKDTKAGGVDQSQLTMRKMSIASRVLGTLGVLFAGYMAITAIASFISGSVFFAPILAIIAISSAIFAHDFIQLGVNLRTLAGTLRQPGNDVHSIYDMEETAFDNTIVFKPLYCIFKSQNNTLPTN